MISLALTSRLVYFEDTLTVPHCTFYVPFMYLRVSLMYVKIPLMFLKVRFYVPQRYPFSATMVPFMYLRSSLLYLGHIQQLDHQNIVYLLQAICTEAGLLALRERRMKVSNEDFKKSKENVLYRKSERTPEGLYL